MMDYSHMGSWSMGIGWVAMTLFWVAFVFGIFYLLKTFLPSVDKKRTDTSHDDKGHGKKKLGH